MTRQATAATPDRLLSREQQAIMLGCSLRTIIRMEASGRLPPAVRLHRRVGQWESAIRRALGRMPPLPISHQPRA